MHVGEHVEPLERALVQGDAMPFAIAPAALHGFTEHVAMVSVPALHDVVPDTV